MSRRIQISQNGTDWTDVDLNGEAAGADYTVESLRNTELFPEMQTGASHYDTEFGRNVTAKKVRISISQVGPAIYEANDWEKENRLQIMELELWNGVENVAKNVAPTVTTDKSFEFGDTWRAQNLTDGDYGTDSDKGCSTDVLDTMKTTYNLENPVTIDFEFAEAVEFSSLRIFPRSKKDSMYAGGEVNILAEYTGADMFANGINLAKGQTLVVNMGQNLTAVPNIHFSAFCGARVQMRFAEMLNDGSAAGNGATQADGPRSSIYQKSLRNARSQAAYVFSGDGIEEYQPHMSFFGYQYAELTASEDMVIYGLTSKGISSVSEQLGQITTNNADVNKFFNNVLFGQLSNYYTTPTD